MQPYFAHSIPTWPPSWPLHHLKLYSPPEHAHWSVVGSKRPFTSYGHSEISQIQFIKPSNVLQLPLPATTFSWATPSPNEHGRHCLISPYQLSESPTVYSRVLSGGLTNARDLVIPLGVREAPTYISSISLEGDGSTGTDLPQAHEATKPPHSTPLSSTCRRVCNVS
jgi:hypothetical protein